ncbi:MAG: hypothetical protein JSR99_12985 [Proteobacteria bacterium]|nr:hypothetical protein [Pseudomonadota bacterium]
MRLVFDCALHFRFLQKATEAMFEMGQASVAAALACQRRVYDDMTPAELQPLEPVNPWEAWLRDWSPPARTPMPVQSDLMRSWFEMASACSLAYWSAPQPVAPTPAWGQTFSQPFGIGAFPSSIQAFWGISPWTFYQGPMVAMMLAYGVPYAVAAPTARASTSAMDAADAACTQWRLIFGSTEGRKSLERNAPVTMAVGRTTYLH